MPGFTIVYGIEVCAYFCSSLAAVHSHVVDVAFAWFAPEVRGMNLYHDRQQIVTVSLCDKYL